MTGVSNLGGETHHTHTPFNPLGFSRVHIKPSPEANRGIDQGPRLNSEPDMDPRRLPRAQGIVDACYRILSRQCAIILHSFVVYSLSGVDHGLSATVQGIGTRLAGNRARKQAKQA